MHIVVITKILSYGLKRVLWCHTDLDVKMRRIIISCFLREQIFVSLHLCVCTSVKILAHLAETSMLLNLSGIQYGAHECGLISWAAYFTALVKIDTTFYTKATFIIQLLHQNPTGLCSRHSLGFLTMSLCASSHQRQQTLWFSVLKNTLHVKIRTASESIMGTKRQSGPDFSGPEPFMTNWTDSSKVLWRKDTVGGNNLLFHLHLELHLGSGSRVDFLQETVNRLHCQCPSWPSFPYSESAIMTHLRGTKTNSLCFPCEWRKSVIFNPNDHRKVTEWLSF